MDLFDTTDDRLERLVDAAARPAGEKVPSGGRSRQAARAA
jgi:hypothetical protein